MKRVWVVSFAAICFVASSASAQFSRRVLINSESGWAVLCNDSLVVFDTSKIQGSTVVLVGFGAGGSGGGAGVAGGSNYSDGSPGVQRYDDAAGGGGGQGAPILVAPIDLKVLDTGLCIHLGANKRGGLGGHGGAGVAGFSKGEDGPGGDASYAVPCASGGTVETGARIVFPGGEGGKGGGGSDSAVGGAGGLSVQGGAHGGQGGDRTKTGNAGGLTFMVHTPSPGGGGQNSDPTHQGFGGGGGGGGGGNSMCRGGTGGAGGTKPGEVQATEGGPGVLGGGGGGGGGWGEGYPSSSGQNGAPGGPGAVFLFWGKQTLPLLVVNSNLANFSTDNQALAINPIIETLPACACQDKVHNDPSQR